MSATFITEDGTGKIDANAYITIAEATDIVDNFGGSDKWDDYSTADKQNAIREATRYLDLRYRWQGYKSNYDQALEWPRVEVYDFDGIQQDYDVIPKKLKEACGYLAMKAAEGNILLQDLEQSSSLRSESSSIGPISESKTYFEPEDPNMSFQIADNLIKQYTKKSEGSIEIQRG